MTVDEILTELRDLRHDLEQKHGVYTAHLMEQWARQGYARVDPIDATRLMRQVESLKMVEKILLVVKDTNRVAPPGHEPLFEWCMWYQKGVRSAMGPHYATCDGEGFGICDTCEWRREPTVWSK